MLAIAALTVNRPFNQTAGIVAVFTAGIAAAYSVLALGGALLWQAVRYSAYLYVGVATIMAAAGIAALVQRSKCRCAQAAQPKAAMSSVFLMGATSVATLSPCCTPVITAGVLYAHGTGMAFAWLTVTCFAIGHAAPLVLAAAGSRTAGFAVSKGNLQNAARVVAGALMLGGAGFYYVLA
jgi:thiol:disulfide interchange protein